MAHPSPMAIPPAVDQLIARFRARRAAVRSLFWLGLAASAGGLLVVVALVIDRFADLPLGARFAMTGVALGVPAALLLAALAALLRRESAEKYAGQLDEATPGSRDLLRSAVNLTSRPADQAAGLDAFMLGQALGEAQRVTARVETSRVLGLGRLPLAYTGAVVAAVMLAMIFRVPMMDGELLWKRFLSPGGNHPRPSLVKVHVDFPDELAVQQGDDVTVHATLSGPLPEDARATLLLTPAGAGKPVPVVMNPRPGNLFEAVLRNVSEPATFTVAGGDGRSERHSIAVRPRPMMGGITVQYTYPRYTMLPPTRPEPLNLRELKGVEGTRVRIDFETPIEVSRSRVVFPESQAAIRWDKSNTRGTFQFTIEKDTRFNVQLASEKFNTDNRTEAPFRVRLVPDNLPTVSLLGIPEDLSLYRDDLLNLSYKGSDDFGISEVFIRYHQSTESRNARDYTLKSVTGTSRQVAGDFSLALRDITSPEDTWVDIELVMVDTKGQEGVSPSVRLQVISSTPDRQLTELLGFQERAMQSISRAAGGLKNAGGRLTVLLDGMDDATQLSGARRNMFEEVRKLLSEVSFRPVTDDQNFRLFLVAEYPSVLQRRAEDLFSQAAARPGSERYAPLIEAIAQKPTPRQEALALKAVVDAEAPRFAAIQAALQNEMAFTRWTLVSYLCSQYLAQPAPSPKARGAAEASTLRTEKQEERVRAVLAQLEALGAPEDAALAAACDAVKAAAAKPESERAAALQQAVAELGRQVDQGAALDGRLGQSTESLLRETPWHAILEQAAGDRASLSRAARALYGWLRLRRDDFVLNPAELFTATLLAQAAMTGDAGRVAQAAAAARSLEEPVRRADLFDRAMLARRLVQSLETELRTGRVSPQTPVFDQAWRQARDVFQSILTDAKAGRFAGAPPEADAAMAELSKLAPAFASWDAAPAVASPEWPASRDRAVALLGQIASSLRPAATQLHAAARAQAAAVQADLAKNLVSEKSRLSAEQAAIAADVAAAAKAPPGSNGTMAGGKMKGRIADPARLAFARELSERFVVHAVTAGSLADLLQASWADQPARAGLDEQRVAAITAEYLSHLEEDVYDKTQAQHTQQVYGVRPYPGYIEEMGRYMGGLADPIDLLARALTQSASGQAAPLAADQAFTAIPLRINKQQRYDGLVRSFNAQIDFVEGFKAATTDAARAAMLASMSRLTESPTAYWDRVYLTARAMMLDAEQAARRPEGGAWPGVPAAALASWAARAATLESVLPPVAESGEEAKALRQVLDDLPGVSKKSDASAVAKLDAAGRNAAREELIDWRGRMEGAMRTLESKLTLPQVKQRPRARLMVQRTDFENTLGRVLRNESVWTERVASAARSTASARAQLLLRDPGQAVTPDDLAYDFAREGSVRRRSAAVAAQTTRSLDIDLGGVDESFLKMPKYLYEELRKTLKKPYPSQFKESELEYSQDLSKDAR